MRKVTGLLFLVCLVSGLMWGATEGKKYQDPMPMHPDTSAPDAWGYTWVRSTDPGGPTFRWVDISTRGTLVNGLTDDNVVGPFDMLFNFPYYWYSANRFKVGSNGYIQFDNTTTAYAPPFAAFPSTGLPNDLMAICVGDLCVSGQAGAGGTVRYWTNSVDSLVVSFVNITEWESTIIPANIHTFQIILNKADSSITYQYGRQVGRYNTTNNTRLAIGIENATGQIGLQYVYSTTPPHALMPDTGLAIKIKRTVNTGLQVTDAGIVGGLNATNLGEMNLVGVAKTIQCVVKNFGTAAITNAPVRYAISKSGQTTVMDTVIVPSLAPSQQVTVTFARQFTPAVTGSYSALFNVTVPGDVGPGNNSKTAEITSSSFTIGQNTVVQYETGVAGGSINWIGGGGVGVAYDLPPSAYPVRIESVYVSVASVTAQPMIVQILDGSSGSPGAVLAERTAVTAIVGMNGISFRSDSIRIPSGRFFVGARGQIAFNYEITAPISFRSWEYTGGWAPYRSGDLQDVIIRASVQPYTPPSIVTNPDTACYAGPIPAYPSGMFGHASETLGDTLYIAGGSATGVPSTAVYTYSLSTRTWGTGVPLPTAKAGGDLIKCGSSLYYIGGGLTAITAGDAAQYKYTPGAGWTAIANIPTPVTGNNAECWGDSVIFCMAGGWTTYLTTIQVYRPASNTWSTSTPLPVGRRTQAGGLWGNKLFIAAGYSGVFRNDFYIGTIGADANTITWVAGPNVPMRGSSSRPGGHAVNGRFYFVTGETSPAPAQQDSVYIWDIAGSTWLPQIIRGRGPGAGSNYWGVVSSSIRGNDLTIWVPGGSITGTTQWGLYGLTDDCRTVDVEPVAEGIPTEFQLSQNYPNPFNPSTTLEYSLPKASFVTLKIYNILGQEVATLVNEEHGAGVFKALWNGQNPAGQQVATGVYFYSLVAKSVDNNATYTNIKKMLLLK